MLKNVLGSVLKEAAERVALEITAAKVAELSTNLESLRRGADLAISVTRKKIAAIEEAAKADREAVNALAARLDLLADKTEIVEDDKPFRGVSAGLMRLRDFLARRYPEHPQAMTSDEAVVDLAICLLTPADGSEEAWKRDRVVHAIQAILECEIGQCRANEDGDVIRLEAQAADGAFVPVGIIGKAPRTPGWPMSPAAICKEWPIALAGKVYADPGPRVGFGG